jgi:hypothetical protein
MIQTVQPSKHGFFDDDAKHTDQQWSHQQHHPIIDAEILQAHPGEKRAHHVERAMGEINHIQQTENHGQTKRQHRIKRAIDQPQQQLAKQNQKKWYDAVKRKQKQNVDMNNENTYRNELYKFLGGGGKLKLSQTLKKMVTRLPLTDQNILKIMTKTIDDRKAAKEKLARAPKVTATPPAGQPGATP